MALKKILKITGIVLSVVVAVPVILQIGLNSRPADRFIRKTVAGFVDGTVDYSSMHISLLKRFPTIGITVDSLWLSYPHDRFAAYDGVSAGSRLLDAGRGAAADTLAGFSRLTARVNPWKLLSGRIRLCDASLEGLSVYAHQYADTVANWNMFGSGKEDTQEQEESGKSGELPWISLGKVTIGEHPSVVFTNQADTVYAALRFKEMSLRGNVKLDLSSGKVRVRRAYFNLDSLGIFGRLPADTLALALDSVRIVNPRENELGLALGAKAFARTGAFGRVKIPIRMAADVAFAQKDSLTRVDLRSFDADVACIPLSASGRIDLYPSSKYVKAEAAVKNFDVHRFIDEYASAIVPEAAEMIDAADLTLNVGVDGSLSEGRLPAVDARAALSAAGIGSTLTFSGKGKDILGENARFDVSARALACIDSLMRFIPDSLGMHANGTMSVSVDADVARRELSTFRFDESRIKGNISSDAVAFGMPSDTLSAGVKRLLVDVSGNRDGLKLDMLTDTVSFSSGSSLRAKVRGMENIATISKVENRGRMVPKIAFSNSDKSLFLKTGDNRIGLKDVKLAASATHRVKGRSARMKHILDSLQRVYPGVSRDSLIYKLPRRGNYEGSDFIKVSVDSSITRYLKEWKPEGYISAGRGFVITPTLPLRTRLKAFEGGFTDNELSLDTLSLTSGTSDIAMKGRINGLRRVLMGRVGRISADVLVNSSKINANELLTAFEAGKTITASSSAKEDDESFVIDTLANATLDSTSIPTFIVPANLSAKVRLQADTVLFSDVCVNPLRAQLRIEDQTAQILRTTMNTNLGDMFLNAFYSTKKGDGINAGIDLKLQDISADGIIQMLPAVDKMMPALKSFQGDLNCDLSATTQLDSAMNVLTPTLNGVINISGKNLYVADAGDLRRITRLLLFKNKDIGEIQNMNVSGVIHDNMLVVYPFELSVDRYSLALQGIQGFDKQMDYHVSVMKSPLLIPFGIHLFGDPDNWKFRLTAAKYRAGNVPAYSAQLDTMKLNVRTSIMNIFRRGALSARKHNADAIRSTVLKYSEMSSKPMSEKEMAELDSLMLNVELSEQQKSLDAEINAVLDANKLDIEAIKASTAAKDRRREYVTTQEKRRAERQAARDEKRKQTRK